MRLTSASKLIFESLISRLSSVVCGLSAAVVLADTSYLLVHYFQPLLYGDSWETVQDYQRFVSGHYGLSDLLAQHNEHRLFFPRLVFLADFVFGRGLNIINQGTIWLIQILHTLLMLRIAWAALRGVRLATAAGVVVTLMSSYGQAENLTWGFQVQFVAVYAAATLAFWWFARALSSGDGVKTLPLLLSFAMVLVSTYSMSNGFLSAFVLVVLAVASRASREVLGITLAFALATAATYFYGFHLQPGHSPPGYVAQHPLDFLQYMFVYLGGPVGTFGTTAAAVLGGVGMILTVLAGFLALRRRDSVPRVALLGVMLFVLVTAGATAFGRAVFGAEQALGSRYLTPVLAFWAAQVVYWLSFEPRAAPRASKVALAAAIVVLLVGTIRSHDAMRASALWYYRQSEIERDVILSGARQPERLIRNYPDPDKLLRLAEFLAARKLNIFALPAARFRGRSLDAVGADRNDRACSGTKEPALDLDGPAGNQVGGWAWDDLAKRPVRQVLIADADDRVIGFASGGWFWYRPGRKENPRIRGTDVGWRGFLAPAGKAASAYALLDHGRVVCRLKNSEPQISLGANPGDPSVVDIARLGAPIVVEHTVSGRWATGGHPPAAVPPEEVGATSGSWSNGMGGAGRVAFGQFIAPSRQFAVPFITGSDPSGATIEVGDAETGQIFVRWRPAAASTWHALLFDMPRDIAERPLVVRGIDDKEGADSWLALGAPHAVRR